MDAYGYLFKGFDGKVSADYVPSLIGIATVGPDAYFERVDLDTRRITALAVSRYLTEEGDVIFEARNSDAKRFYIPKAELEELAAFHHDDDTFEMINALVSRRVH